MTNLCAAQKRGAFPFLSEQETKLFLGLQLTMGYITFPRIRIYWEEGLRLPIFDLMSRNRFLSIRTNIHLIHNNTIPVGNKDKFIKVRPLFESVRSRCQRLKVEECISFNEQIVPFMGKLEVRHYIKNKPNPFSIKLYCLCRKSGTICMTLL